MVGGRECLGFVEVFGTGIGALFKSGELEARLHIRWAMVGWKRGHGW